MNDRETAVCSSAGNFSLGNTNAIDKYSGSLARPHEGIGRKAVFNVVIRFVEIITQEY